MTAHPHPLIAQLSPDLHETADRALRTFIDWESESRMRRKIVDHYSTGWCDAEFALQALIGLSLIEFTPGIADE
jgi:hypothetical protein